jgi:hypothetical protein
MGPSANAQGDDRDYDILALMRRRLARRGIAAQGDRCDDGRNFREFGYVR